MLVGFQKPFCESNLDVLDKVVHGNTMIEVEQFKGLSGIPPRVDLERLYYMQKLGLKMKRLKITLAGGSMRTKKGALHMMVGDITLDAKAQLKPGKKTKPLYSGSGVVYLEPTFGHYVVVPVNGTVYIDHGLWICADGTLKTKKTLVKGSGIMGGDGMFQTKIEGTGWVVLHTKYPTTEIQKITLNQSKLSIDGPYGLLRTEGVDYSVEFAGKGFFQKMTNSSGEGKICAFEGTGEVWLCPTENRY